MMFTTRWSYQTRNLLLTLTPHLITFFLIFFWNLFIWTFSKCQFKPFYPSFRRWTGPRIHANQNNKTTTKNIDLVLCFVTISSPKMLKVNKDIPFIISKIQVQYLKLNIMDSDGYCAHSNIRTIYISFNFRRYGSLPQDIRSHGFKK